MSKIFKKVILDEVTDLLNDPEYIRRIHFVRSKEDIGVSVTADTAYVPFWRAGNTFDDESVRLYDQIDLVVKEVTVGRGIIYEVVSLTKRE